MAHPAIGYTLSAILLTIIVVVPGVPGSSATCNSSSTTLPAGYVSHPEIAVAYKVYSESVTWKVARQRCISEGAHLAVIDTFIKFEFMIYQAGTPYPIWVGIHRMYDDTEWVSASTGSTLTNLPWAPGMPDREYDCVMAWAGKRLSVLTKVRGLENWGCSNNYYYVCEIPIPRIFGSSNG